MFFRMLPDGHGEATNQPKPEAVVPDRSHCLECAFGKLLVSGGVQTAELDQARGVIAEGQSVSTASMYTRATIYRCGALGCDHAVMAVTEVSQPPLPDNPDEIKLLAVPGSSNCALPEDSAT